MSKMFVDFVNNTGSTWTMGLYQTLPDSPGLESVAWLQSTAPDGGETGVEWQVDYQAMLANYRQVGGRGVYKSSQKKNSMLGRRWKIVYSENVQQLVEDGSAERPDQIIILNDSGALATPGIGMSGQGSVFKSELYSGTAAQFIVKPTYHFGLFRDLVQGEVISSNVIVGPLTLVFEGGQNAATVTATIRGESIVLDTRYSRRVGTPLRGVEQHRAALEARYGLVEDSPEEASKSGTLKANQATSWERKTSKSLSFDWADPRNPGTGTCSVRIGDATQSLTPPSAGIDLESKPGKLTNNTDRTIRYTLET